MQVGNWKYLKTSLPNEYIVDKDIQDTDDDNNDDVDSNEEKIASSKMCKSCMNCSVCCYNVLLEYKFI